MKPEQLDCPLVAGCSIGYTPQHQDVSRWDEGHVKYFHPTDSFLYFHFTGKFGVKRVIWFKLIVESQDQVTILINQLFF